MSYTAMFHHGQTISLSHLGYTMQQEEPVAQTEQSSCPAERMTAKDHFSRQLNLATDFFLVMYSWILGPRLLDPYVLRC